MTREELNSLFRSTQAEQRRAGIDYLVTMLAARDKQVRRRGYAMLREQLEEALFQSCLNYRGLVRGFTNPLESVMEEAIERWASTTERSETMQRKESRDGRQNSRSSACGTDRRDEITG